MRNDTLIFPYYSGNIKLTKVLGYVTLTQFIRAHKEPTPRNAALFRKIKECTDSQEKRKLKHKLYSFTPSVLIDKGLKRSYKNLDRFTGLMQIDLDGIDDYDMAVDVKHWVFQQKECVCAYLSPSNNVKALIHINKPLTKDHYIRLHNAVTKKYEQTGFFDTATKNAVLPLFLSCDADILWRDIKDTECWSNELVIQKEYNSLNTIPTNFNSSGSWAENKTRRLFTDKIRGITCDGHPQVRTASLILGSRVGAGYISRFEAEDMAKQAISQNSYLSKGTLGYIETALWAIGEGIKSPRYY